MNKSLFLLVTAVLLFMTSYAQSNGDKEIAKSLDSLVTSGFAGFSPVCVIRIDHQMKFRLLIFLSCLTTLFGSCQTATKNTLEEFKKVDSSLQKSNSILTDNYYSKLYSNIQNRKNKNPKLAAFGQLC